MSDIDKLLHDLKTKRAHGAGNMITHMVMDEAHAEIIRLRAALDAQSVVAVKSLVWVDEHGDGVLTSRETGRLKRIFPQYGGGFCASSLATELFKTPEDAMAAYQADHEAFVLRCIEPTSTTRAEVAQENEYRDVLSAIAFGLGVGSGDKYTTAKQFNDRINQGIEIFGNGAKAFGAKLIRERAAQHIDSCSEGPWAKFGFQMAREVRALPTTFTHTELLAAAMRLPDIKALVDAMKEAGDVIESYHKNTGIDLGDASQMPFYKDTMVKIDAALAPFTRKGE
jgi:hypothetical protein